MSMSYEHKCQKCKKHFDSFSPRSHLCGDCEMFSKIRDLPPKSIVKIGDSYGRLAAFPKEDLVLFFDEMVSLNDPSRTLVLLLNRSELNCFENSIGRKVFFEDI